MADTEPSLGTKILRLFIKDDEASGRPAASGPATPAATPNDNTRVAKPAAGAVATPAQNATSENRSAGAVASSADARFAQHFADVLGKANVPGPDYFEFREMLRNLESLNLGEEQQYRAAWASFRAMAGPEAQPAALTKTAGQYLNALNADRDAFQKSADAAVQERVGGLQAEQKRLEDENATLQKQIADLQQKLDANQSRLANIGEETAAQRAKLDQNRQQFDATFARFTDQIQQDIQRIQTYLT